MLGLQPSTHSTSSLGQKWAVGMGGTDMAPFGATCWLMLKDGTEKKSPCKLRLYRRNSEGPFPKTLRDWFKIYSEI